MKNTFKSILILLVAFVSVFFVGCSNSNVENNKDSIKVKEKIKIATLKGPTGMGMVKLMEENKNDYDISLFDSPDQIVSKIVNGEFDAATIPSNLAAILYNKMKGTIQLAGVNTLGVLYVVENGNTIKNIKDLKGKTIYSSGKGATPEFILNYILNKNGLNPSKDVNIEYNMQHTDLAASIVSNKVKIAVLPEPFITIAKMKNKNLNVPINLTNEWEKESKDHNKLVMGTIIFRKDYIENNKKNVDEFLNRYKASIEFTNKNKEQASKLIEKYAIVPKLKIAELAIPKCNIVFINSQDAKKDLQEFYKVLFKNNPKSIGGKIPDAGFYYESK
ncbi:ABC transporter substrate-binding protein [Clostridium botulinum]|uniref:ABC transporter substrate-binding protein n=1 Tax=Clostridium botulinum TaxID=1491 RepID=UPI00052D6F9B|nr:ABC transporter substrate-binding protein [Clostridium botulinum]KGM94374.1 lipoprotein [Clostridium botulinum D str. CCUG 7971]KOC50653.1 hypothetical protein ADU88_01905 [Clostridium botulinum]NFO98604.1 ABC transporter substrate-binding protein [Clostridium botulinum]OOV52156.1 hypothetical protein B1A66_05710 [Clostridium botulinum D/C]OOV54562.1 hypothetical protein B0673_10260 [Clostridium botulinum D/C]